MHSPTQHYDLVITGGGVIGLSLALYVRQLCPKLSIAVLEARQGDIPPERVSALNPASYDFLTQLGAFQAQENTHCAFERMHIWDIPSSQAVRFNAANIGQSMLGIIAVNHTMIGGLKQQLSAAHIDYHAPVKLQQVTETQSGLDLMLSTGQLIQTSLLIGADGANSWLRKHRAMACRTQSYQQDALIATLSTSKPHQHTARQQFSGNDIIALLPLADAHQSSLVFSSTPERIAALSSMTAPEFNTTLTQALQVPASLGDIRLLPNTQRYTFPLIMRHTQQWVQPRIALVGDAAHTIHPLAGQGLNLGLRDVQALAELLAKGGHAGRDISSYSWLRRYERARKADVSRMIAGMGGLQWVFGSQQPGIIALRGWGLQEIEKRTGIKRWLMGWV